MAKSVNEGSERFSLSRIFIVVAIMGLQAAVVVPSTERFLDRDGSGAAKTELQHVQSAVFAMMVDNRIFGLPNPVSTPTADMTRFPDRTESAARVAADGVAFQKGDGAGWVLYGADLIPDNANPATIRANYVAVRQTLCTYTADFAGTVMRAGGPLGC